MGIQKNQSENRRAFTILEVADSLRISKRTVERLLENGQLGCVYVGNALRAAVRITGKQLDEFIEARSVPATDPSKLKVGESRPKRQVSKR